MQPIIKLAIAGILVAGLCACGNQPNRSAEVTVIQPLSQVEWVEKTAASHAAVVSNNGLILMR